MDYCKVGNIIYYGYIYVCVFIPSQVNDKYRVYFNFGSLLNRDVARSIYEE